MKGLMKRLIKDQGGQALLSVLILMALGGLTISPLLTYMSAGLKAGQVHEEKMYELYAADAGVEDALWKVKTAAAGLPGAGDDPWEYSLADVNDRQLNSTIEYINSTTYKITSNPPPVPAATAPQLNPMSY